MLRRFSIAVFLVLLVASQGCATHRSIPALPAALGEDEGLLVARLYVLGMQAIENASVEVDGTMTASGMVDGYIGIPLPSGTHKLSRVRAVGRLLSGRLIEQQSNVRPARSGYVPSYIYVPSYTPPVDYTTLSVDRSFEIQAGRITNLGLLVYLPVKDPAGTKRASVNESKQFQVIPVDNRAEARAFLETNYPELMASLANHEVVQAPTKYIDAAKLPDLRRAIAYHESSGPNVVGSQSRFFVYGRAGTIVGVPRAKTGDTPPAIEVLDTGTLADVVGGVRHGERFTFVTSDARLITWEGGKVEQAALPQRVQPVGIYAVGKRGMMVIDNRMRILTASAPGEPWAEYQGLMVTTPRKDVDVAPDQRGAFISIGTQGLPSKLFYLQDGASAPQPITAPEPYGFVPSEGRFIMIARPAGLFVLYAADTFLFRSSATQLWAYHTLPAKKCEIKRLDDQGAEVVVECGGATYRSTNSGATWIRPEA